MNDFLKNLSVRMRPEYFFWGAALLLFLFFLRSDAPALPARADLTAGGGVTMAPKNPYADLVLEARAAVVYDWTTKRVLFRKEPNAPFPLASIAKIMTAATALSLIPDTTRITISERALAEEGDSGLASGEVWMLRELIKKMLLESSNDAAYALSSTAGAIALGVPDADVGRMAFIARMNEKAQSLRLRKTLFRNESGLDLSQTEPGAVSTAKEAAYLFGSVLSSFPSVFGATRWEELVLEGENGERRRARNTNDDTGKFPLLIASKTGYTDLAGGNLVIAFDAGFNHPIIVSVLGSSKEGRFTDAEKLVWATLERLAQGAR